MPTAAGPGTASWAKAGFYGSAVAVAIFVVRVLGDPWTSLSPVFPDSYSYLEVAARGPLRPLDERPFLYPTFLWLTGRNVHAAVLVQTLVYAGAFLTLCLTAVRALESRLAAGVVVVITLALAVTSRFALWNTQILTEALGVALGVAGIAAWWSFCAGPTPRGAVRAWIWTLLWLALRDSNTLPVAVVIVPVVVLAALSWRGIEPRVRDRLVGGAGVALFLCAWIYVAQDVSQRTQYSMHNNIGHRVLRDPDLTRWFVAAGMPLDDALRDREGRSAWDEDEAFLQAPELERYRRWAAGPGRRRMLSSLVLLFPTWYERLAADLPGMLHTSLPEYDSFEVHERLPERFPPPLGLPGTNSALATWMAMAAAGLGLSWLAVRRGAMSAAVALFACAGLVSALVDVYCSYVGDPLEVGRHLIGPSARLAVMVAVCIGLGVEAGLRLTADRPRAPEPVASPTPAAA